jgi:hypothetical protein
VVPKDPRKTLTTAAEAPTKPGRVPSSTPTGGWGRCRVCECQEFKDTSDDFRICGHCGHEWTEHRSVPEPWPQPRPEWQD